VIAGLYALGSNRDAIQDALKQLAGKPAFVERARDGSQVDSRALSFVLEDLRAIAGESRVRSRAEAKRRGELGGRPPKEKPMSDQAMLRIWRRKRLARAERADLIGLPMRQVYRWLEEIEARQNSESE
jgi:hypothetical protein